VVVGHGEASVRHALHRLSVEPVFVRQPALAGTAPAVAAAFDVLESDLLVAYGDIVTPPENLAIVKRRFEEESPAACVLVSALGRESPSDWICADVSNGAVAGILGHPRGGAYRLAGVFALRKDAVAAIRDNPGLVTSVAVGGMPPLEADLAASLQLMVDDGVDVAAEVASEFVVDMDRPWHILEANERMLAYQSSRLEGNILHPSARVDDSAEVHGRLVLAEGAEVGKRVVVHGDLWLGPGARVTNGSIVGGGVCLGARAQVRDYALIGGGSSLGPLSLVGHGAEFDGVLLDRAYLYHYCEISGVVGSAVDIGAASVCGTLRFDDRDQIHVVKGRREVPPYGASASFFGDYSRTGVNAIIMPGCKVGVYSCVGPGVVLTQDLPSRTMVLVKQELVTKPWGPEKYGW
ncbi:MAG: nucleotidyl transferase, partial [Armatimonadota bacterium]